MARLIYIKAALVRDDHTDADLIAYQQARPRFPYDSTGDQFYDVEQFEAYRELGVAITRRALDDLTPDATLAPAEGEAGASAPTETDASWS